MNSKKLIYLTEGKVSRQAFLQIQIKVKKYLFFISADPMLVGLHACQMGCILCV